MLPFIKHRLHRLGSQLTVILLVGFLGIGIAIGVPVILLISQQSSSHAQRLLDQAVVTSRAFLERERADLQSLALLTSQRPTLIRLLQEQNVTALESYLETLRKGANVDLILICSAGQMVTGTNSDRAEFCQLNATSGYAVPASGDASYLYTTADVSSDEHSQYTVFIGKLASSILRDLQKETGLLYFLLRQDQLIYASDPSIEMSHTLATGLLGGSNNDTSLSLQQRSFRIANRRYLLSNLQINPSL